MTIDTTLVQNVQSSGIIDTITSALPHGARQLIGALIATAITWFIANARGKAQRRNNPTPPAP